MLLNNIILRLDFLSVKPSLLFQGKFRFKTSIGAFFSFLTLISCIAFSIYFLNRCFERTDFKINTIEVKTDYNYQIFQEKFPFVVQIRNGSNLPIENFDRVLGLVYYQRINGTLQYFDMKPCNFSQDFGIYKDYFISQLLHNESTYYCVKEFIPDFISQHSIIINRCDNKTNVNKNCFSLDKINTILQSVFITYYYLDYLVDSYDPNTPGKLFFNFAQYALSSTIYKRYYHYYCSISYQTDTGFIFPNINNVNFFQYYRTEIEVDLRVGALKIGLLTIDKDRFKKSYTRTYTKLQDVAASIGGVVNIILGFFNFVTYYFTSKMMFINLANSLFNFKKKKKKIEKKETIDRNNYLNNEFIGIKGLVTNENEKKENVKTNIISENDKINTVITEFEKNNPLPGDSPLEIVSTEKEIELKLQAINSVNIVNSHFSNLTNSKQHIENEINDDGKFKLSWKNFIFPNSKVKKISNIILKKMSIDDIMANTLQTEKLKRYLFDTEEELIVFNNLPEIDFDDFLEKNKRNKDEFRRSLGKLKKSETSAKLKYMSRFL